MRAVQHLGMAEIPDDRDSARPVLPPPLFFAAALGLGLALDRMLGPDERAAPVLRTLGTLAIAGGALIGATAFLSLRRAGTSPNPYQPANALVTGGLFRFSRNPAYFGATSIYLGVAMRARSLPALVLLPVVLALLDHFVVDNEERYLERRFGDAYRAYRETVPRWF